MPGPRRWTEYLVAILAGNATYFILLAPHLPEALRHEAFHVDAGLVVDFFVCLGFYGLIRWFGRA